MSQMDLDAKIVHLRMKKRALGAIKERRDAIIEEDNKKKKEGHYKNRGMNIMTKAKKEVDYDSLPQFYDQNLESSVTKNK